MDIVPYRVRFNLPKDLKDPYSTPNYSDIIDNNKVELVTDEGEPYFKAATHDRGNGDEQSGPYYQVIFRVENDTQEELNGFSLHLDTKLFRNVDSKKLNDLQQDKDHQELWYQRTRYKWNTKLKKWDVDNRQTVDAITASGVFGVVAMRNGRILNDVKIPMVYVLPSTVSRQDYLTMLNDLIRIHESLVFRLNSQVGVDKNITYEPKTYEELETQNINKDIELLNELLPAVRKVMRTPLNVLAKRYVAMPIHKVKRYDGRVLQEYAKTGGAGKVHGVEYYENHDIYENRAIKYVLESLVARYQNYKVDNRPDSLSESTLLAINSEPIQKNGQRSVIRLTGQNYEKKQIDFCIEVEEYETVTLGDAAFFCTDKGINYVQVHHKAQTRREQLDFLKMLIEIYAKAYEYNYGNVGSCKVQPTFTFECENEIVREYENKEKKWKSATIECWNVLPADNDDFPNEDISEDEYFRKLNDLITSYNRETGVTITKGEKMRKREAERAEYKRKVDLINKQEEILTLCKEARSQLNEKWFRDIKHLAALPQIHKTQLFTLNRSYRDVYPLLLKALGLHPMLSVSFDANRFGVFSTEQVYEYWVFYAILRQLQIMGFRFTDPQKVGQDLTDDLHQFVRVAQPTKQPKKSDLERMVEVQGGPEDHPLTVQLIHEREYEIPKPDKPERMSPRLPDYSIYVKGGEKEHWYFMDAKYKPLVMNKAKTNSCVSMIQEVGIRKYMKEQKNSIDFDCNKAEIRGSYIIAADIRDGGRTELAENGRLFGGDWYINEDQPEQKEAPKGNNDLRAKHKYGAIKLTPSFDKELKALFQMIFEYLETNQEVAREDKEYNKHPLLNYCWECGTTINSRTAIPVSYDYEKGKHRLKYYTTCPACKSFRVDNYCIKCRKLIVKHTANNYHQADLNKSRGSWAYLCPACGAGVDG